MTARALAIAGMQLMRKRAAAPLPARRTAVDTQPVPKSVSDRPLPRKTMAPSLVGVAGPQQTGEGFLSWPPMKAWNRPELPARLKAEYAPVSWPAFLETHATRRARYDATDRINPAAPPVSRHLPKLTGDYVGAPFVPVDRNSVVMPQHQVSRSVAPLLDAEAYPIRPTYESLGQQLQAQGYYAQSPGGLAGRLRQAQLAALADPMTGAPSYTAEAINTKIPINWAVRKPGALNQAVFTARPDAENITMSLSPERYGHIAQFGQEAARDPHVQATLEHELTHAAQHYSADKNTNAWGRLNMGRTTPQWSATALKATAGAGPLSANALQFAETQLNSDADPIWDYYRDIAEVDARLAPIVRQYHLEQPGATIKTKEDAAKALDWFNRSGYKRAPDPAIHELDLPVWEYMPEDRAKFRDFLLRRMLQVVQQANPGATANVA